MQTAAAAIAVWATRHYARKGFHFNALIKAFELLNDNAHRNARIRLYTVAGVEDADKRRAYLMDLGVKKDALETIRPRISKYSLGRLRPTRDIGEEWTCSRKGILGCILEHDYILL